MFSLSSNGFIHTSNAPKHLYVSCYISSTNLFWFSLETKSMMTSCSMFVDSYDKRQYTKNVTRVIDLHKHMSIIYSGNFIHFY